MMRQNEEGNILATQTNEENNEIIKNIVKEAIAEKEEETIKAIALGFIIAFLLFFGIPLLLALIHARLNGYI